MKDELTKRGDRATDVVFDPESACAAMGVTLREFLPLVPRAAEELRLRLDAVRRGMAGNDPHAVALNSHTMKSVSASLGAEAVRRAALNLERSARDGDGADRLGLLAELEARTAELLTELDRF